MVHALRPHGHCDQQSFSSTVNILKTNVKLSLQYRNSLIQNENDKTVYRKIVSLNIHCSLFILLGAGHPGIYIREGKFLLQIKMN
jgi:hypothetical protein